MGKNKVEIDPVLITIILLFILTTIILIQPVEVELHGRVDGSFKGLIDILKNFAGGDFTVKESSGSIEGDVKVKVPLILVYILLGR